MIRFVALSCATLALIANAAEPYDQRLDVQSFVAELVERHGFDEHRLLDLFHRAHADPQVIKAIMPPVDPGVRSWRAYRSRFVEPRRLKAGLAFWQANESVLVRAKAEFGIPAEIIVAIIGVETYYGRHPGRFQVFNALTNLAFDYPPRAPLFRGELEALLLLAREEQRSVLSYRGSYAGAIGLPQFLPSSQRRFAVDFDRDGHIDLAGSAADAIGSVARFLKDHGWETGQVVARVTQVDGDPGVLLAEGIRPTRLPSSMAAYGVSVGGMPEQPAALIDLASPDAATEYRLGFQNFFVLTRYNRSSFYAAAVLDLAESLREAKAARARRP